MRAGQAGLGSDLSCAVVHGVRLQDVYKRQILHEDGDSVATVCPGEKHILFALGKTTLVCRLIDGEFLNYNAAIPASFEYTVTADTRELITCLERVSLLVSEKLKNPVRITFDGSVMKMTCITAVGKSYDECAKMCIRDRVSPVWAKPTFCMQSAM